MFFHRLEDCLFLCPLFCYIEQLTMPEEILPNQLVTRVYQNSRKAESMLRNIIMFQVIQYLRDKTGLGWRGGCQGKMSYSPLGIVDRNTRLASLCMLRYDLGPT